VAAVVEGVETSAGVAGDLAGVTHEGLVADALGVVEVPTWAPGVGWLV